MKKLVGNEISNFTRELKFKNTVNVQVGFNENNEFAGYIFTVVDIISQKEFQIKEKGIINHPNYQLIPLCFFSKKQ